MSTPIYTFVFKNGLVYTVDKDKSWSQAIGLAADKIVFVGKDEEVETFIGPGTRVVNLNGKMVLPGFVEAHAHPSQAMDIVGNISLYLLDSPQKYLQEIESHVNSHPGSEYYRGSGWADQFYPGLGPKKETLDNIVPNKPITLTSYDGHSQWVNSVTLERAQINKDTPNPAAGVIERDPETGEPTGTLREKAMQLVEKVIPDYTLEERKEALLAYQEMALAAGITMSHDAMLEPSSVAAFKELEREGLLKMRFCGAILMEPGRDIEEQIEAVLEEKAKNQHAKFWTNAAKIFVDGVIEGGTAYLLSPYEHKPDYFGVQIWDANKLNRVVSALDAEGMQIHFHAIGDGAARIAIDALETAQLKNGRRDSRHLITHLQLVAREDIPRFKNIGAIGVPQPFWFAKGEYYRELALPFLGKERADAQYPMKSFIEAGIPMASASDFPVTVPFDPLLGIQTGIIRYAIDDGPDQVLWAEESVSLEEMVESFTLSGALANFTEDKTGSLEVGKQADLVVLDRNLFNVPQDKIANVKVLLTVVDGEIVYREKDFDG